MSKVMNERDIKIALCRHIKKNDWKRSDVLISEYFVENASRRADIIAANGHLVAFEIKSDVDSLARLEGQIASFSRHFESVTIVCTERHLGNVLKKSIPNETGIICISDSKLHVVREPMISEIANIDIWLSHLPISAIRESLSRQGLKCPRTGRSAILKVAKQHFSPSEVRTEVLRYIKTKKRQQRISLKEAKNITPTIDPLTEHRKMLRNYLELRNIDFDS